MRHEIARMTTTALCAGFIVGAASLAPAAIPDRAGDPVVMTGVQLPDLQGLPPGEIVAFRHAAGWEQVPVQIDERAWNDYGQVYNSSPTGLTILAYCDAGTFMGPDSDPTFDADDEIVFMAGDLGGVVPPGAVAPANVLSGSRVDLEVNDPLTGSKAYVYLFRSDGSLDPAAGVSYVDYTFNLLSGPYLTTYNTTVGPNPEDSEVVTGAYSMHFSDRWIRDEIKIHADGATGVDILDRHKNLFAPENCGRSEATFCAGEGAFFVNKSGPVRAVRSYLGANSGPFTQREHLFYERRHEVRTFLRVHAIPGIMDFYDYDPAAAGMLYYSDINPTGVTIDGSPVEVITPGAIAWEMVSGGQGTLVISHFLDTDIPGFTYTSYYLDEANTSVTQCTGDDHAYGSSGLWVDHGIPNTDPYLGAHSMMTTSRIVFVEAPDQGIALAQSRHDRALLPLTVTVLDPTDVVSRTAVPVFELAQNQPNPFNPSTVIRFELPRSADAALTIHALDGRLIATLVSERLDSGPHSVFWDGRDREGRLVPSGVYVYRLIAGDLATARRLTLLK